MTISFVISDCSYVRPHGAARLSLDGFPRNLVFEYFLEKSVEKIKFYLNLTTMKGTSHEDGCTFMISR